VCGLIYKDFYFNTLSYHNRKLFKYIFINFNMGFGKFEIKARIIRKLVRWGKWGGAHTENILKGLPSHLIGAKITKEVMKELIKDQWIIPVKKTGEIHYFLNQNKVREITEFYEKHCKDKI